MAQLSKPVEQLIIDLHQGDMTMRSDAARELGKSRDTRAVAALLPDLQDKDWRVRRNAAQALGALKAKEAVDGLILALKDRTMTVRMRAAVALGRIKDPQAIPALLEALEDKDGDVSYSAAQALQKFGKQGLPALKAALPSSSGSKRLSLIKVMAAIPGANVIEDLLAYLNDPNLMVRVEVILMLTKITDPRALEGLLGCINDPEPVIRTYALQALGSYKDARLVPTLLAQLKDNELYGQNQEVYRSVTRAMQKMAGLPKEYEGVLNNNPVALAGLLDDEQRFDLNLMMSQYSVMLKQLAGQTNPANPMASAFHKSMGFFDQIRGAGNQASRQVEGLMGLLSAASPLVRAAAALSLVWYMDARALQPLSVAILDQDAEVHQAAAWAYETLRKTLSYKQQMSGSPGLPF